MLRVVFLIRSLESGGAERQLVTLVRHLDPRQFDVTILTYYPNGALEADVQGLAHVSVQTVNKQGRGDLVGFVWRLWREVRRRRPHIVHGYMSGANELALVLGRPARAKVVWGVRASNVDLTTYDWATRGLFQTGRLLSHGADLIIANSVAGRDHHVRHGYRPDAFVVIPNGIDTEVFRRDLPGRARLRADWQIADDEIAIGIVARLDPMKDHETFLRAAAALVERRPQVKFVVVGEGTAARTTALHDLAERLGVGRRTVFAGARRDVAAVCSAFDIATSSSAFGEGFANTLGEAMACECVCVATAVGDAPIILAELGGIVPPRDPQSLSAAWTAQIDLGADRRAQQGRAGRARVEAEYSVRRLVERTAAALAGISRTDH